MKVEPDCPVCMTMAHQWEGNGCACWWCPSCKATNPEGVGTCQSCHSPSPCPDCGAPDESAHHDRCFMQSTGGRWEVTR